MKGVIAQCSFNITMPRAQPLTFFKATNSCTIGSPCPLLSNWSDLWEIVNQRKSEIAVRFIDSLIQPVIPIKGIIVVAADASTYLHLECERPQSALLSINCNYIIPRYLLNMS